MPPRRSPEGLTEQCLRAVVGAGRVVTTPEVARILGLTSGEISNTLERLVDQRELESPKKGYYAPALDPVFGSMRAIAESGALLTDERLRRVRRCSRLDSANALVRAVAAGLVQLTDSKAGVYRWVGPRSRATNADTSPIGGAGWTP